MRASIQKLIGRSIQEKKFFLLFIDFTLCFLSLYLSFWFSGNSALQSSGNFLLFLFFSSIFAITVYSFFGLYREVVSHMGRRTLWVISLGTLSVSAATGIFYYYLTGFNPWRSSILFWIFCLFAIIGYRQLAQHLIHQLSNGKGQKAPIAIYGAGTAGLQVAYALEKSPTYKPCFFIDDDEDLQGRYLKGLPVIKPDTLHDVIYKKRIKDIVLAMPSISVSRRREIIRSLLPLKVRLTTVPRVGDIISGISKIDDLRIIDIQDVLGRDPVLPDIILMKSGTKNKSIMITGAGGSIGSELCLQLALLEPSRLVLLDSSEYNLYQIERKLKEKMCSAQNIEIIPVLGNVIDEHLMERLYNKYIIDTVYHAAAYKHVPLSESNPVATIFNNCFGTLSAARAAIATKVTTFVLISTDKAVRPTNIMGASKRLAELILQALSYRDKNVVDSGMPIKTKFCMVRFGNVLGSSGSVVPLFQEQIRAGGPITITHPEITRYFMTITEAAQLVIQAGILAYDGDVCVLDMGDPVKISDLARTMIQMSGLRIRDENTPDGDIEIEIIGLRPGEKLYEELLIGDKDKPTTHPKIRRANENYIGWSELEPLLQDLRSAMTHHDGASILEILTNAVAGFTPKHAVNDISWDCGRKY